MVDTSNVKPAMFDVIAAEINAMDFDHVFRIDVHAESVWKLSHPGGVWAPDRVLWEDGGVTPESHEGWELLKGMSNAAGPQDGVNHSSEFVGRGIAQELVRLAEDETQTFVVVTVECYATDDEIKEKARVLGHDYLTDAGWDAARDAADAECEPAGWAILRKVGA